MKSSSSQCCYPCPATTLHPDTAPGPAAPLVPQVPGLTAGFLPLLTLVGLPFLYFVLHFSLSVEHPFMFQGTLVVICFERHPYLLPESMLCPSFVSICPCTCNMSVLAFYWPCRARAKWWTFLPR